MTKCPIQAVHATAVIASLLGEDKRVLKQPQVVERLSRDCCSYSPVMNKTAKWRFAWLCSRNRTSGRSPQTFRNRVAGNRSCLVTFCGLDRDVAEQELDLIQFAAG